MPAGDLLQAILAKLDRGDAPDSKWPDAKGEHWGLCPFHPDDHSGSFSVSERGYRCFACGAEGSLRQLAERVHVCAFAEGVTTTHTLVSLAGYAEMKHLPLDFLKGLGLSDDKYRGRPRIRIPYFDQDGTEAAVRYRIALTGKDKFLWAKGAHTMPYGLSRLDEARRAGYVILIEGESDSQTLWYHGLPALGIPGATNWKPDWATYLAGLAVYVWREPDDGGTTFVQKVGKSLPEAKIITPPAGRKDISECHILGDDVPALLQRLMAEAVPYRAIQEEALSQEAAGAKAKAGALLRCPDILGEFAKTCQTLGLVSEDRNAKLLFLALTSRLLDRPVSVCVKGPSSGGKSFLVENVLKVFPPSAFYALSSMSEHALAYSQEPLSHRMLVLYEASGLASDFGSYLMRTLLSEGCIKYETVMKTDAGLQCVLIDRPGPTGLIVTTTWARMHPENETRMLSITVRDDPQQTRGVFQSLADRSNGSGPVDPDVTPWHALQTWLELAGAREVMIPYAHQLAEQTNPRAVRLRRDFGVVLNLVRAHAVLHQASRGRDAQGRIVATLDDYRAVYDLVIDIVSEGVKAMVSQAIRETVQAVVELSATVDDKVRHVTVRQVAKQIGLDDSATWRRVQVAVAEGFLRNDQDKRYQPAMLRVSDPLPEEEPVLPHPDDVCVGVTPPNTHANVHTLPARAEPVAPAREVGYV